MKRSRNRARLAALLIVIGLVGAALTGAAGASLAAQERVTLQLSMQDPANAYFEPFIREFESANPKIKVEISQYPNAQYASTIRNQIAAGDPPDVMIAQGGYTGQGIGVLTLADANLLENLAKESWAKNIPAPFGTVVTQGKKVYSSPLGFATIPSFYNQKVFRENSVAVPKTYPELLEVCEALSAAGVTPISLAGQFDVGVPLPVFGLASATVFVKDPDFAQKRLDGKTTFAGNKQWKRSLDRYVEMNKNGCFGKDPVAVGFTTAINNFATDKAGMFMFPGGVIVDSMMRINPALEIGSFALPGATKAADTRLPVGVGFVPVVLKGADEKAAAKKLVAFLVKNADKIASAAGSAPLHGTLPAEFAGEAPQIESGKTVTILDQLWPNTGVIAALQAGAQDLLLGRSSATEVLTAMDVAFDQS